MHYKSRKLQKKREEIRQALLHLGWEERESRYPATDAVVEKPWMYSPHVMTTGLELETDLKRINEEKTHRAVETLGYKMEFISWQCNRNSRKAEDCVPLEQAMEQVDEWLVEGIPYVHSYVDSNGERVKVEERLIFVDWDHPERNSFSFVQNWRGMRNDGFAWDFVLMLNSIPLCVIVLAPYAPKTDDWELEAVCGDAIHQTELDYILQTYLRITLYGNGKEMSYATVNEPDSLYYLSGDSIEEQLKNVLSHEMFIDYLAETVRYVADNHILSGTAFWAKRIKYLL